MKQHKLSDEHAEDGADWQDSDENRLRCGFIHCDSVFADERCDGDRSDFLYSVPIDERADRNDEADGDDPRSRLEPLSGLTELSLCV